MKFFSLIFLLVSTIAFSQNKKDKKPLPPFPPITGEKIPLPPKPVFAGEDDMDYSEGLKSVEKKEKWGFSDKSGKIVIPIEYDNITPFSEGLAAVSKGGKYGYIDKSNKVVLPFEYNLAGYFTEGLAIVSKDGWGVLTKNGEFTPILPPGKERIKQILQFSEGLSPITLYKENSGEEICGYINAKGEFVIPPIYAMALHFKNGIALVNTRERFQQKKKSFYIDKEGKYVKDWEYDLK